MMFDKEIIGHPDTLRLIRDQFEQEDFPRLNRNLPHSSFRQIGLRVRPMESMVVFPNAKRKQDRRRNKRIQARRRNRELRFGTAIPDSSVYVLDYAKLRRYMAEMINRTIFDLIM